MVLKKEKALKSHINDLIIDMPNAEWANGELIGPKSKDIEVVKIPNGVEVIKANAFYGCKNLKKVYISNTVRVIEENAFTGCENLQEIIIPSTVRVIGDRAFQSCRNLRYVKFEDKLKGEQNIKLGKSVFADCEELVNVRFAENINSIPEYTFYDCKNLKVLKLPKSCLEVKENVFAGSGLQRLEIEEFLLVINFDDTNYVETLDKLFVPIETYKSYKAKLLDSDIRVVIVDTNEQIQTRYSQEEKEM